MSKCISWFNRYGQGLSQDPSYLSFGQVVSLNLLFGQAKIFMMIFQLWLFVCNNRNIFLTNHHLRHIWSVNCHFWHTRLLNVASIRIWSRQVDNFGRAKFIKLLFWTGIFEILAKTMGIWLIIFSMDLKNIWERERKRELSDSKPLNIF